MKRTRLAAAALVGGTLVGGAALLATGPNQPASTPAGVETVRIGTYDSRAIAMAYAASDLNPVKEKMAEMAAAKEAGDDAKIQELEHWGQTHQRLLHFQGFGHYPVDDHLALVAERIPEVAAAHDLDAIVWLVHESGQNVVVVDVTEDLARLFSPPERVWKSIEQMKGHKPVPFETLIDLPVDR